MSKESFYKHICGLALDLLEGRETKPERRFILMDLERAAAGEVPPFWLEDEAEPKRTTNIYLTENHQVEMVGGMLFVTPVRPENEVDSSELDEDSPPPWSEAPGWATHRAQNPDGWWVWCGTHEDRPIYPAKNRSGKAWVMQASARFMKAKKGKPNPNWEQTREERPTS